MPTEIDVSSAPEFSVVIPAFNEASSIPELVKRIDAVFTGGFSERRSYEIIVVDDGSKDDTRDVVREYGKKYHTLRIIVLRRNVGKSMALMTGFLKSRGKFVVTLDADLQDCPEDIPGLVEKIEEGYDLVSGKRSKRQDSLIRRIGSFFYNYTVRKLTGLEINDLNCGFKIYRREVVEALAIYGQFHRYIPLIAFQAGFKVTEAPVQNMPRKHGTSKFSTFRYQGLFDLMSIIFTYRYNLSPLHFFAKISAVFVFPSAVILTYLVGGYLLTLLGIVEVYIGPRPLLSLSLTMFMIGVSIFLTGFVCDFMLNHMIKHRIEDLCNMNIEEEN